MKTTFFGKRSAISLSTMIVLGLFSWAGITACCSDPIQYCLKFVLSNDCTDCKISGESMTHEGFTATVAGQEQQTTAAPDGSWSLCWNGLSQGGGDAIDCQFARLCSSITGGGSTLETCAGHSTTDKACDVSKWGTHWQTITLHCICQ